MFLQDNTILCDDMIIYILDYLTISKLLNIFLLNKYSNNFKYIYNQKIKLGKKILFEYNLTGHEREFMNFKFINQNYLNLKKIINNLIYILPNLQGLYLTHTTLENLDPIVDGIYEDRIEKVYFGWNNISNINPLIKLFNYKCFKYAYLSGNKIFDIDFFCKNLYKSNIIHLSLSFNKINNVDILFKILPLTKISILDLSGNQISNINLHILAKSLVNSKLERLSIWQNPMTVELFNSIQNIWINSGKNVNNLFIVFR